MLLVSLRVSTFSKVDAQHVQHLVHRSDINMIGSVILVLNMIQAVVVGPFSQPSNAEVLLILVKNPGHDLVDPCSRVIVISWVNK
ncbi:hypothetical protein D3C80_1701060 [compost metagenome]